jgi:cation:H+ antiporter
MSGSALPLLLMLAGLAGLWAGTVLMLRGAHRMTGPSGGWSLPVGLTVLTVGTALPELGIVGAVAWTARGDPSSSGLIMGTVIGSLLARATIVLAFARLLGAVDQDQDSGRRRSMPSLALGLILVAALGFDETLSSGDGAVLCVVWLVHHIAHLRTHRPLAASAPPSHGRLAGAAVVAAGLLVVAVSGWGVGKQGLVLSEQWGVAPLVVGLLVLGLGASLPELLHGVGAALGGAPALSVVRVLDRGLVGLLIPLGLAALLSPVHIDPEVYDVDLPALGLVVGLLTLWRYRGVQPTRSAAVVLLGYFMGYALLRILLG